ncbi:MAG: cytoplasmic protein [Thermodesulfobacteriota bacterium]
MARFDGNPVEGYKQFEATSLYCPRCREAVPVRKRLLLILPEGEEYEYLCGRCGSSVGIKLEKGKEEVKVLIKP